MTADIDLRMAWERMWSGSGARGDGASLCAEVLARYAEPHRHYHGTRHLAECLSALHAVRHLAGRPAVLEAALWFHDAIYDPARGDNEAQSAAWAERSLRGARVQPQVVAAVRELVLLTRHDGLPATTDELLLIDVDLGILGASRSRFEQYEREVRAEYAHVPDTAFRAGRRRVLQSFTGRQRIYRSVHFHTLLEARARDNLGWSITRLDGHEGPG